MKLFAFLAKREKPDLFAMGFTTCLILMVSTNNLISIYKQLNNTENSEIENEKSSQTTVYGVLIIGLFFLFNVVGNLYRAMTTDTSIYSLVLPVILLRDWKYCSFCEQNSPPRAFHCFSCRRCVLKRHNHCMFMGTCAGLRNMRFYLLFMVHVWLGLLVSIYINWQYYVDLVHTFDFKHVFIFFMPLFAFALGIIGLYELFISFTNAINVILSLLLFFYMLINFIMAARNQTWHERAKLIDTYDLGWKQNLIETFGYNWFQASVNPFALIRLPSNGTSYMTKAHSAVNYNVDEAQTVIINDSTTSHRRRDFNTNTNII